MKTVGLALGITLVFLGLINGINATLYENNGNLRKAWVNMLVCTISLLIGSGLIAFMVEN